MEFLGWVNIVQTDAVPLLHLFCYIEVLSLGNRWMVDSISTVSPKLLLMLKSRKQENHRIFSIWEDSDDDRKSYTNRDFFFSSTTFYQSNLVVLHHQLISFPTRWHEDEAATCAEDSASHDNKYASLIGYCVTSHSFVSKVLKFTHEFLARKCSQRWVFLIRNSHDFEHTMNDWSRPTLNCLANDLIKFMAWVIYCLLI